MSVQEAIQWGLPIASAIISASAWLYGWQSRKHSAQLDELQAVEKRVKKLEMDTSITRERLQHIPTTAQLHDLHAGLTELRGDIKALTATIVPLEKTVGLIDVHLRSMQRSGS